MSDKMWDIKCTCKYDKINIVCVYHYQYGVNMGNLIDIKRSMVPKE